MSRMTAVDRVSPGEDLIDSRDVIEAIEALQGTRDDLQADIDAAEPHTPAYETALAALAEWSDGDENALLSQLRGLQDDAEGYSDDWQHGAQLIADAYFEQYAQELAEDLHGEAIRNASWPFSCIDWDQAARELQQDYTSITFGGIDYWIR